MAKKIQNTFLEAEAAKRKSDKNIDKLVIAIRKGESTGNAIKDFVIASYYVLEDSYLEKKLTALQDEISNNQGEQLLIIEREEIIESGGCFVQDVHQRKYQNTKLGVIKGEISFDFKGSKVRIPMRPYAEQENTHSKWVFRRGYPTIGHFDMRKVNSWTNDLWEENRPAVYLPDEDNAVKRRIIKTIVDKDAIHWYLCHSFIWKNESVELPNKSKIAADIKERNECHPRYAQALQILHLEYQK